MISRIQWMALLLFYLFYLLIGAFIFQLFELGPERESYIADLKELRTLQIRAADAVHNLPDNETKEVFIDLFEEIGTYSGSTFFKKEDVETFMSIERLKYEFEDGLEPESNYEDVDNVVVHETNTTVFEENYDNIDHELLWNLWNSFFFTFTCITTIGYGNMSPSTEGGQIFSIIYSLIGVPLNCILFSGLAELFGSKLIKKQEKPGRYNNKLLLLADVVWYLVPGLVVLMVIPAGIFTYMEGWTYTESFYFAFISLTTIGFGDLVAGRPGPDYGASIDGLYKGGIFIWIVFGLGYLLMVVTIIQQGLRSEEIRQVDRKVAKIIKKKTENVNMRKDLERIGRILNTINFLQIRNNLSNNTYMVNQSNGNDNPMSDNLKKSPSDPDFIKGKVKHIEQNNINNVNVFMDIAETILQKQENGPVSLTQNESGPTSTQSDPNPSGNFFPDNLNLKLISTIQDPKNKSDSFLNKNTQPTNIKREMNEVYLNQCKDSLYSYTNKAFSTEGDLASEKGYRNDVESGTINSDNSQPTVGIINRKLSRVKDFFVGKTSKAQSSDYGTDSEDELNVLENSFNLSNLLGEIETILLRQVRESEVLDTSKLKRTQSVPMNKRGLSNNETAKVNGDSAKSCSGSNENIQTTIKDDNRQLLRRWTLASIAPPSFKTHPTTILHSISEPTPNGKE